MVVISIEVSASLVPDRNILEIFMVKSAKSRQAAGE
jgi:hypothetical protein